MERCHFNLEFQIDGPWGATPLDMGQATEPRCAAEATHCPPCHCETEVCFHSRHPVCERHYFLLVGYMIGSSTMMGYYGYEDESPEEDAAVDYLTGRMNLCLAPINQESW